MPSHLARRLVGLTTLIVLIPWLAILPILALSLINPGPALWVLYAFSLENEAAVKMVISGLWTYAFVSVAAVALWFVVAILDWVTTSLNAHRQPPLSDA